MKMQNKFLQQWSEVNKATVKLYTQTKMQLLKMKFMYTFAIRIDSQQIYW